MPEAASAAKDKVHFFISRAGADAGFAAVIGKILEDADYRVILQNWDFADKNFIERMHEALIRSERVILLLSPEYLASPTARRNGSTPWRMIRSTAAGVFSFFV